LPNITGYFFIRGNPGDGYQTGAFYSNLYPMGIPYQGSNSYEGNIYFDASRSSSIYKDSATTVVPESLITNFYIKY